MQVSLGQPPFNAVGFPDQKDRQNQRRQQSRHSGLSQASPPPDRQGDDGGPQKKLKQ
jgi:hypothetical protein